MSRPAYLSQPTIQRLPNLLREVREGDIRIPRFQRPYVWTDDQRLLLLRSIYEGMPIGSLLIWRTKENDLQCFDKLGPLRLPSSSRNRGTDKGSFRQYLLDGHQRLTTLYVALGEGLSGGEGVSDLAELQVADDDENWPIFFDLQERTFRLHTKRKTAPPDTWLPLSILLDPTRLYELQKRLLERKAERDLVNRAESLASTFKDYSIPVVPIVTEDLELATESFQRVNTGGTKMTEVHMVSALTWTREFDLNERLEAVKVELGEVGWEQLEEKMILNVCKALLDLDIYNAEAQSIKDALKEDHKVLDKSARALREAGKFLRERCNICGPVVLPYSFQIVLLADALHRATEGFEQEMSQEVGETIEKWFWLTTYSEHFSGISAGRLARNLDHLRLVVKGKAKLDPPGMVKEVAWTNRFDFRTARSRAFALQLARWQADRFVAQTSPYQLLEDHGRNAVVMLITEKGFPGQSVEGPENRILVHPKEVTSVRNTFRSTWWYEFDPELFELQEKLQEKLRELHGIDDVAAKALETGDISEFLARRRATVMRWEKDFVENLGLTYTNEP